MRKGLASHEGQRKKFMATFSRVGTRTNYHGHAEHTLLLTDVIDVETSMRLTDHVWFTFTKGFEDAGLKEGKEGTRLEFEARVKEYKKGYVNTQYKINQQRTDYKLSHPTKIKMVMAESKSTQAGSKPA